MTSGARRGPYPFVDAEDAEFYTSAGPTWERLLHDFSNARRRLLVENFIYRDGLAAAAVSDVLVRARRNGADVRVLADGFGSSALGSSTRQRFERAGIDIRFYHPGGLWKMLFHWHLIPRTHRRIFVIDGRIGWVGGLAFDDQWWPAEDRPAARDTMLRYGGPGVAQLEDCFETLWRRSEGGPRGAPWPRRFPEARPGQLRVVPQYAFHRPHYRVSFRKRVGKAQERIWIAVPYFIPSPRLRRALHAALDRDVDVRLLLPGPHTDHPAVRFAARRYYGGLLRDGARIFEYQPSFLHAKCALFDWEWCLIGSSNLDRWSMYVNNEVGVELRDPVLAESLEGTFREDFARSREITWEAWLQRPWRERFAERVFGSMDRAF